MQTTTVDLGSRSYEILIGENLLDSAAEHILPFLKRKKTVIITDENVAIHQLSRLEKSLKKSDIRFDTIILPAGETTKSFKQFQNLLEQLIKMRLERSDTIIAFGGGVIGDLVGFAASVYLRGINFIQIPTSLLAQVDSSVGGKTGINSRHGKNLIGAFHQPQLVIIDVTSLETLERRHVIAGYAEIVKYGLINDSGFFGWLEQNGDALIAGNHSARIEAIRKSCAAKAAIVSADEKEAGVRALLNLGHTFGHALEAENGYRDNLYHGEAVAMGCVLAFQLSHKMGLCPKKDVEKVEAHFKNFMVKDISQYSFNIDHLLHNMRGDKKMIDGKLKFVLVRGIGHAFLSDAVDMNDVKAILGDAIGR